MEIYAIILAAGRSTRMRSQYTKILHTLMGKPLIFFPLRVVRALDPQQIYIVVNPDQGPEIEAQVNSDDITYVVQEQALGTGHAVMQVESYFEGKDADVLVIPGDAPLVRANTVVELYQFHRKSDAYITVLTAELPDPTGYGRIIRAEGSLVAKIVEERDASDTERQIREVNSGIYFFRSSVLFEALHHLKPLNAQREYYLTDVLEIVQQKYGRVHAFKVEDWKEILGVNTRQQLAQARAILQDRINEYWMNQGVTLVDPGSVYIEWDVELAQDVVLYPFVALLGKTKIGEGAIIGPNQTLIDAVIPPHSIVGLNQKEA